MMPLNRSGVAKQPCLTPLEMVNQSERVLLMRTQLDVSVYSRSSTRTILGGMPMEWRMCHRQSRSTESNVALKLTFRKYPAIHTNYIISHCTTNIIIIYDTIFRQKQHFKHEKN